MAAIPYVTNVTPGKGGKLRESTEAARLSIPDSLRHGDLQRAVALPDYAEAARQVPGVGRAAAKALGGVFNTVLVLVDPVGQADLSEELRTSVYTHINKLRMAGREHFVERPEYVPLEVSLALCVEPGFLRHEVRDRVLAELHPGDDVHKGYFHPDRLNFGDPIELGELIAFVQRLPGVRSVHALAFRRAGIVASPLVTHRIILESTEVGRLDADDDFPENGTLRIRVVGLDLEDESTYQLEGPGAEIGGAI